MIRAVTLIALCFGAGLAIPTSSAQTGGACTARELLANDENYISEVKYTLQEHCRKQLLEKLRSLSAPSLEERYLIVKLAGVDGQPKDVGQAYARLCEAEGYARACSAAAFMVAFGDFGNRDSDLMRFLLPAATEGIPLAQVYLGTLHIARFEQTGSKEDLCSAMQWWRRAAKLNDPAATGLLKKLSQGQKATCVER